MERVDIIILEAISWVDVESMSRINVRYYREHPPMKERELSLAAYIVWNGMTPAQQEGFKTWAKEMNSVLLDFTERAGTALRPLVEKIGQIMQNYEEPKPQNSY